MNTNNTSIKQLIRLYSHPSAHLFRAIELKTIYQKTKKLKFKSPSLDLGSGDGKIAKLLFSGKFTYGVDNGEAEDYQESIDNKIYKKVLVESAEKMSLPNASVEFVFSNSVIEHIPDNNAVLNEVSRILRRGGHFIFTCPSDQFRYNLFISTILNKVGLRFLSRWYIKKRNNLLNHYHLYSHIEWTKKLKKRRLKVVDYGYYITRDALLLWDKMALLRLALRLVGTKRADGILSYIFGKKVKEFYDQSIPHPTHGASLFIHAIKV